MYEVLFGDSLKLLKTIKKEYALIYLDPPFNTDRVFKYSELGDDFGFKDKWSDNEYQEWLENLVSLCKEKLEKKGTLFFHISAENSFIPEKILQKYFKKIEPIFFLSFLEYISISFTNHFWVYFMHTSKAMYRIRF